MSSVADPQLLSILHFIDSQFYRRYNALVSMEINLDWIHLVVDVFGAIFSAKFWTGVKLALDIVQSVVFTLAAIIGGIWALKTFGYDERVRQLERLNRAVITLRESFEMFRLWGKLHPNPTLEEFSASDRAIQDRVLGAQAELRDALDTSMRIDLLRRLEWTARLLPYSGRSPAVPFGDVEYKEAMQELAKISAEIAGEGHFGLPRWLRYVSSRF